jgi:hypothetical protein
MFRYWPQDSPEAWDFSTILVGLLSESTQGAADPNELLRIASGIRAGNRDDWTFSFQKTGNTVLSLAERAARDGHRQTAAESYLRAPTSASPSSCAARTTRRRSSSIAAPSTASGAASRLRTTATRR